MCLIVSNKVNKNFERKAAKNEKENIFSNFPSKIF
jgi:hypothetical protein